MGTAASHQHPAGGHLANYLPKARGAAGLTGQAERLTIYE